MDKRFKQMGLEQKTFNRSEAFRLFIPLVLIYAASYFQRTALPGTIFNELQHDLALNAVELSNLSSAFVAAYALPQIFAGILIDRYCGTRVLVWGGAIFCIGVLWTPFATSLGALFAGRIITGLGSSTMFLSLVKETDRLFGRENYAKMFGFAYFCGYGGGLCGTLPFAALCSRYPWRDVLWWCGVAAAGFYLLFLILKRGIRLPEVPPYRNNLGASFKSILSNRYSWICFYCSAVNFGTYFTIQTVFGKKFLMDFAGMGSDAAAAVIFMLTVICMIVLLNTGVWFKLSGKRRKPLVMIATGFCFVNTLLMTLGIWLHLPGWYFVIMFGLFAISAGTPAIFSMVIQELNCRQIMTQSTAILNMCGYMTVALVAPVAGAVMEYVGGTKVGEITVYPAKAYLLVFAGTAVFAAISFALSTLLPETKGHYLKLKLK